MDIIISNSSKDPIYLQIVNQIKAMILNGTLPVGEPLPSMRTLAQQMRISVITTKRAYEELEREGYIESYTGKGSFVKAQNADLLHEMYLRQIEELLGKACEVAKLGNVSVEELKEMLDIVGEGKND